jgi:hypothetical protein
MNPDPQPWYFQWVNLQKLDTPSWDFEMSKLTFLKRGIKTKNLTENF